MAYVTCIKLRAAHRHCPIMVLRTRVLAHSFVKENCLACLLLVCLILKDNHALRRHLVIKSLRNAVLADKLLSLVGLSQGVGRADRL